MGGNALKTVETKRIQANEYYLLCDELQTKFMALGFHTLIAESYANKEDFGDIDVIINKKTLGHRKFYDLLVSEFEPQEIFVNSHYYSFDYKGVQVDAILVEDENFMSTYYYFSYNDLGNFMGRIAISLGFKYGSFGLVYRHYVNGGNKKLGEILVSKDIDKILKFLGYDPIRYSQGFDNLEDIFEYVIDCKYFNPKYYYYENLNSTNRERNKKRKNYVKFLEYVNNKDFGDRVFISDIDKESMIIAAEDFFNVNLKEQIAGFEYENNIKKEVRNKFSGKHIISLFEGINPSTIPVLTENFKNRLITKYGNSDDPLWYEKLIIKLDFGEILSHFRQANNL
jgi:hypothetical protein